MLRPTICRSTASKRLRRYTSQMWALFFLGIMQLGVVDVFAQTEHAPPKQDPEQILSSYEGQIVSSIDIAGHPEISFSQFAPFIYQKTQQPFSKVNVDRTAAALKDHGKFEGVRVQVEPDAGGLRVVFILEPAMYFGIFQFPGAEQFSYARLIQIAHFPTQAPFDSDDVERDREGLVKFFQQEGYFQAKVNSEVKSVTGNAIANVLFHVDLSRRSKFGAANVAGVSPDDKTTLEHRLTSLTARARGAAIRAGKTYHQSTLTKATAYIQAILRKQGLLGAQVKLTEAEYHADTNRADIHFSVIPGAVTHVRIEGAHLWSWTQKSLLPVYQGIGVDDEAVHEGQEALVSHFQSKGYFDAKVDSQLTTGKNGQDIVYRVMKEKKHRVEKVSLSGNAHLPSS